MDNNEKLFEGLLRADGINPAGVTESERAAFGKMLDEQSKSKQSRLSITRPDIWRIIMKSRITKLAAAATIVIAVILSINIIDRSVPAAFGIEQVIDAYNNVRFLHVKQVRPEQRSPNEFWIKSDEQGRVVKARYYLPETGDGVKLITWKPEGTEIWFKSKRWLALIQTKRVESRMQSIVEQCQPKLVMQQLLEDQKAGKVDVDTRKPAVIAAIYKAKSKKEIYYINQETGLITRIEFYRIEDNKEVLRSTTEYCDYNVPIDEKMFTLKDEITADVRVADRLNQICGVPQGDMTDEQAATETIRQYLQALIDKDYKKAGLICLGTLEEYAKEDFGWCDVTKIISIGPAIPQPDWREHGFKVTFEIEIITSYGRKITCKDSHYVSPEDDEMHPDRWNITSGGLEVVMLEPEILPDNEKYEKMGPKETASALGDAFAQENWEEVLKFVPLADVPPQMKKRLGGLQIISISEPFKSDRYPGWLVPYEIKLKDGTVEKNNLPVRNDNPAKRYVVDGGF